ncbi:MAG: hypothetical protein ACR2JG_14285 [Geodermatophilaceae bacterium]
MTTDPRARRSPAVRVAVLVLCALIGLLAVRVLLTFVLMDSLLDLRRADYFGGGNEVIADTDFGRSIIENWRPDYIRHALFLFAIPAVLLALCAVFVAKGARWVRITGVVISVLILAASLSAIFLARPYTVPFNVIDALIAVTAVGAIVYLILAGRKEPVSY